jgi:hypothetical protein
MITLLLPLAVLAAPTASPPDVQVRIAVDSAQRTVVLTSGPYHVPAGDPAARQRPDGGMHAHGPLEPFRTFTWPIDGWLRAVSLRILDAEGKPLPRRLIHHINVVNLDRRQLLYPAAERLIALGQETEDVRLPTSVGIPVSAGSEMGLVLMWHNMSDQSWEDVTVELEIEWLPSNFYPRPVSVLPVYMDVTDPVARPVDFDLPPGRQVFSAEFLMPIDGRIIGVGGHLHDHGTGLRLTEVGADSERVIVELRTDLDADGHLLAVERKYPGIRGSGIKLRQGRTYRMRGSYHNTTGATVVKGAMVHLILLFAPERMDKWPEIDGSDERFALDVRTLKGRAPEAGDVHTRH